MARQDNIPEQHGFQIPEGYLDGLEERLESLSTLERLPQDPGFELPDGYFESLEDRIMSKVQNTPKVRSLWFQKSQVQLGMAAAALLLLALFIVQPTDLDGVELPEASEVAAYLESEALELTTDDLLGYMEESELDELFADETLVELEELETYILENLDDSELLIELQQ